MKWNRILGLSAADREQLRDSGYGYLKQGDYEAALIYFEGLSLLEEENLFDLQARGCIHLQMGQEAQAIALFERALEIDPTDVKTQLNRAKALCSHGEIERGLAVALRLAESSDEMIASLAEALVMAYGE